MPADAAGFEASPRKQVDPGTESISDSDSPSHVDVLFQRYSRLVLSRAHRVLGDRNEAEDVVQEVFLYIHRKSELFDPTRGSLKAWILQIAVSRALDRKTYLTRRGFYTVADLDSLQLSEGSDLEQLVEARLHRKHLETAFSGLSSMQRRTIECFYFEGMDLRNISERLQEPLGRVRHHLYRGLERLRKSSVLYSLVCK